MSRRRNGPIINLNLAHIRWPVHENYVVKTMSKKIFQNGRSIEINERYLSPTGGVASNYSLNWEDLQKEFPILYAGIEDERSALEWCKSLGLPINQPVVSVDEIIGSAAFITWLITMIRAVKEEDIEELSRFVQPKQLDNNMEIVFSSKDLPGYKGFYNTIFHCGKDGPKEEWLIQPDSEIIQPIEILLPSREEIDVMAVYPKKVWLVHAAKAYLKSAFSKLLTGVLPTLDWRQDISVPGKWDLVSTFAIPSPWQAINFALFQELAGVSTLTKCRRPDCSTFFFRKRDDHNYCSSGCRKWCDNHGYNKIRGSRQTQERS